MWASEEQLKTMDARVQFVINDMATIYPRSALNDAFGNPKLVPPGKERLFLQALYRKLLALADKEFNDSMSPSDVREYAASMRIIHQLFLDGALFMGISPELMQYKRELTDYINNRADENTKRQHRVCKEMLLRKNQHRIYHFHLKRTLETVLLEMQTPEKVDMRNIEGYVVDSVGMMVTGVLDKTLGVPKDDFRLYLQAWLVEILSRPDAIQPNAHIYPTNQEYRKVLELLATCGWLKKNVLKFDPPMPGTPYNPSAESLRAAAKTIQEIQTILFTRVPPKAPPAERKIITTKANSATTSGDRPYQQDTHISIKFEGNLADDNNPRKQLDTLTERDRCVLMWNLFINLQSHYGERDKTQIRNQCGDITVTGSTANVMLAHGKKLYFANVGDSDTYILVRKKNGDVIVKCISPSDGVDKQHYVKVDYEVDDGRYLSMNRSIGDVSFEQGGLAHHPHVVAVECVLEEGDSASVLHATDGIRDSFPRNFNLEKHLSQIYSKVLTDEKIDEKDRRQAIAKTLLESAAQSHKNMEMARKQRMTGPQIKQADKDDIGMDNATVVVEDITAGQSTLTGVFDGHGGVGPCRRDISGETLVSKQIAQGIDTVFRETLKAAYDFKVKNPDYLVQTLHSERGTFDVDINLVGPVANNNNRLTWASNDEALGKTKYNTSTLNYDNNLCSSYPILTERCLSWSLTPRCVTNNNGFGVHQESDSQYHNRTQQIDKQLSEMCKDKKPTWICLQTVDPKIKLSIPEKYSAHTEGTFRTYLDNSLFELDEKLSKDINKDYLDSIRESEDLETPDCHCLVIKNKATHEQTLLVNAHFIEKSDVENRAHILQELSKAYHCTHIKIIGHFQAQLTHEQKKKLNDQSLQTKQALDSAVHFDFQNNKQLPLAAECGIMQSDKIGEVDVLVKYNLCDQYSATLHASMQDCLNSTSKITLLRRAWDQVCQEIKQQNRNTMISELWLGNHGENRAAVSTIDYHKVYQTNTGTTRIENVTPESALAGVRLFLAARMIIEFPLASGKTEAKMLTPDKNAKGLLCYPKEHPLAGQLITVQINHCKNANLRQLLTDTAINFGLTIDKSPTPHKPAMPLQDEVTPGHQSALTA